MKEMTLDCLLYYSFKANTMVHALAYYAKILYAEIIVRKTSYIKLNGNDITTEAM